jgi:hypothetical protein
MLTMETVQAVLANDPKPESTNYRNAWATVAARLARTNDPVKADYLLSLQAKMREIGEPRLPATMSREQSIQAAQAANEARVVGRCKAQILGRIAAAQFQRTSVSDRKPWMFEAALQLIEENRASVHSHREEFPERGFQPATGARKVKTLILSPYDAQYGRPSPWTSRRKQAEEERI